MLSSKSKAYSVVGTPCYISPELCEGKPYNQKSDIWALGCVLYELATLKKAFEAGNLLQLISKIMRGNFAPISDQYSAELSELIIDMLHLDPTKRPQINEILCHPLVVNAYMNYFANLGSIPTRSRAGGGVIEVRRPTTTTQSRTISFSTDGAKTTAGAGGNYNINNNNNNSGDGAAKPSLKQSKPVPAREQPSTRGPSTSSAAAAALLPAMVGQCPLDIMAQQCGYDLTPVSSSIVYAWGGSSNLPAPLPLPNADTEVIQVHFKHSYT